MEATIKTEVAIIGAGPTGLSLATQFVRHGIDFVIIDKNKGITPYSKAIGVQARTLEIYDQHWALFRPEPHPMRSQATWRDSSGFHRDQEPRNIESWNSVLSFTCDNMATRTTVMCRQLANLAQ